MTDSFVDVGGLTVEERLHQYDDGGKPHHNENILRFLHHERNQSYRDIAETLSDTFNHSVSHATVQNWIKKLGLKKCNTFADVIEAESDDTEVAQPSQDDLHRTSEPEVHPLDTDCFDTTEEVWGGVDSAEVYKDANNTMSLFSQSNSKGTNTDSTDQPLHHQWRVGKSEHESGLIAPPTEVKKLPDQYQVCGCQQCDNRHYLDGDGGAVDCPEPLPCTVGGARRVYQTTEGTAIAESKDGNDADRARKKYTQTCKVDSGCFRVDLSDADLDNNTVPEEITYVLPRPNIPNITTALVSLRLSNTDSRGRIIPPYTLIQDAKQAFFETRDKENAFPNDPEEHGFIGSWYTFTGTDNWGTVHIHEYSWYFDPADSLRESDFTEAIKEFERRASYAADCHLTDDSELQDGCVHIKHEPLCVDPEVLESTSENTEITTFAEVMEAEENEVDRLTEGVDIQSRGSIYVATQIPEFALVGAERPAHAEFRAALQASHDGRNTTAGTGYFYRILDDIEAMLEDEQVAGGITGQSRDRLAGD